MDASARTQPLARKAALPKSDVSPGVGLAGLAGLIGWIALCRAFPAFAEPLGLPADRGVLSGPNAALMALFFTAAPMAAWSVLIDKVHLRASTGLDWNLKRNLRETLPVSAVKIAALWLTFAALAALYALGRFYWEGQYLFAMQVFAALAMPLALLCVPYVVWLDRFMIEPRDASWHFGALLLGRSGTDSEEIRKHCRAWLIKGFFGAFMISILPPGFAQVVEADFSAIIANPVALGSFAITALFLIDVQIGTVGYIVTMRPLDAHIRSGNPFLAGWIAALLCYPPFSHGILGNGSLLFYEQNTAYWDTWLAGNATLLWIWAGWLVFLTAIYAWATMIFGIRFSNLTYRGVITNGPYRFTRHPAYLSKNLFWWSSVMPFFVIGGSPMDAVRNCFFLLVVNAIYYWRARTEEAHLLAEDPKYREYYAWMERHGPITAPLARLARFLRLKSGGTRAAIDSGANEGAPKENGAHPAE